MEKTWKGAANGEQGGRSVGALKNQLRQLSSLGNRLRPRGPTLSTAPAPQLFSRNSITRGWLDFILSVVSLQLHLTLVSGALARSSGALSGFLFLVFFLLSLSPFLREGWIARPPHK